MIHLRISFLYIPLSPESTLLSAGLVIILLIVIIYLNAILNNNRKDSMTLIDTLKMIYNFYYTMIESIDYQFR